MLIDYITYFQVHLLFWAFLHFYVANCDQARLMKSIVTKTRLSKAYSEVVKEVVAEPGFLAAISMCKGTSWCEAICETAEDVYTITSLYIIGGLEDTEPGEQMTCYTTKPRVLYPAEGVSMTASASQLSKPLSNLFDGIYDGENKGCYHSASTRDVHVLIEFPTIALIRGLTVRSQPQGQADNKFVKTEFSLGNVTSGGDFSSFVVVDSFAGAPVPFNTDVVYIADPPVWAKYALFVEKEEFLQICTIEIF